MKFNNVIKGIILEQGRYEILKKAYTEPKKKGDKVKPKKMDVDAFDEIVKADPTTRTDENGEVKKAGKYTQWLLKQFTNIDSRIESEYGTPAYNEEKERKLSLFFEDLYKTTEDLQKFDRFKNELDQQLRDINKLNIETLYDAVKDFSLEKATTTKAERKTMKVHPGAELVYEGPKWDVFKIEDKSEIGREAACFYGGSHKETRWCTSMPGRDNWFNNYISKGPLYVLIDKTDVEKGEITGLPKHRYQFHFQSGQFMDVNDRQINLIDFLNSQPVELKEFFKPEFAKNLTNLDKKEVIIDGNVNRSAIDFINLYGFNDLIKFLPENLERLDITLPSMGIKDINLEKITDYKNLFTLHLSNFPITNLPDNFDKLDKLMILSLPDNTSLKSLPKSLAKKKGDDYILDNLMMINISRSNPNILIPKEVQEMINKKDITLIR